MVNFDTDKTMRTARGALGAIVLAYAGLIMAALARAEASHHSGRALRLCRTLQRHVRRHVKQNARLFTQALHEEITRNPALQARVRRDLGGTMAMVKWEARRRGEKVRAQFRAANGLPEISHSRAPRSASQSGHGEAPPKRWRAKTDRHGHYRMAVISTGKRPASDGPKPSRKRRKAVRVYAWIFHPAQVSAEDLRAHHNFGSGFYPPPRHGPPPTGHPPPIIRPPI